MGKATIWCQHFIEVGASLCPICSTANPATSSYTGKEVSDGLSAWAPNTHLETQMKPLAHGFSLAHLWLLQPLGE